MLTEIRLENFKSFGELTSVPLAPISVFIGPNGAGKSTPIQAALLLKRSARHTEISVAGDYVNLGPFADLVHMHSDVTALLGLTWQRFGKSDDGAYKARYSENATLSPNRAVRRKSVEVDADVSFADAGQGLLQVGGPRVTHEYQMMPGEPGDRLSTLVGAYELTIEPTTELGTYSNYFSTGHAPRSLDNLLRSGIFYGPGGIYPEFYPVPASRTVASPKLMQANSPRSNLALARAPEDLASETATTLGNRTDLAALISEWAERVTGRSVQSRIEAQRDVSIESIDEQIRTNLVDEGHGTNQLVTLFLQLALATKDSVVTIEEPELHLHPKAQAALADVLREVAQQEQKQLIITTHSEHILFRLLSAVASGDLKREDLSINYFEKVDGATKVTPLEIDDKGRVKGGLPGFFEAELDELSSFIKALGAKD